MIVEICANGYESASNAAKAGAHRIELCTQLAVGGLTPSHAEISKVLKNLQIETHVLIRPRKGDFVYSEEELQTIIADIKYCKETGCRGVVSGVLTAEGDIDLIASKRLIEASGAMEFTFHRAFDECNKPKQELEYLIDLGVKRVLSSGQAHKAIEGLGLLIQLKDLAAERIEIMPGSGIHPENALAFKNAGFPSIHLSATSNKETAKDSNSFFETGSEGVSDIETIKNVLEIVR